MEEPEPGKGRKVAPGVEQRGTLCPASIALPCLAGRAASADRVSAEANVPRRLLARILASLSRAGLVESEQGRGGGSRLARPAREITLRDAVEAAEGPFGITRCIMQNRACGTDAPCAIHDAWQAGQQAILEYLQKQSLEDFITQNPSGRFPPKA